MWLARFVIFKELGLIDSYGALVAPALMGTNASFVLLFIGPFAAYRSNSLSRHGSMGPGRGAVGHSWACPLPAPPWSPWAFSPLSTTGVTLSTRCSPESESRYTLAIGLRILQQLDVTNWPLLMAGATIMTLPVLAGYFSLPTVCLDGRAIGWVDKIGSTRTVFLFCKDLSNDTAIGSW